MKNYNLPDLNAVSFTRTNPQTLAQRVSLICELLPEVQSIADLCCGDCSGQWAAYTEQLNIATYRSLDLHPEIVVQNQQQGIDCHLGDVLDSSILSGFLEMEVMFFGPPLSLNCDGHSLLPFDDVTPHYSALLSLLMGELNYQGTVVCICPKSTTMGEIQKLYQRVRKLRNDFGLRMIHYSSATITGGGEITEPRLKYVELWFSSQLDDSWEVRKTGLE